MSSDVREAAAGQPEDQGVQAPAGVSNARGKAIAAVLPPVRCGRARSRLY